MTTLRAQGSLVGTLRDLVALTKPRITVLVIATSAGGLWLAPGRPDVLRALVAVLAIAAVVMSANALNCWMERVSDREMTRTQTRPLPAGRLDPRLALGFGLGLGAVSVPVLGLVVNPVTGLLGAIALVSYVWMYTPLKQRTWLALLVGAVPGAMPPLMGWTAATGAIELPGLALFAVLFLWQIPHFIAIAVFRQSEYERAGIRVLPAVLGVPTAKAHMVAWCIALVPASLVLTPLGVTGSLYLASAVVLGLVFVGACVLGLRAKGPDTGWARRVFSVSLAYLTLLFAAMVADAV
jgi:protoheme IX farnesyltransferase